MSYHPGESDAESDHNIFVVGQDVTGGYHVRENHGHVGSDFVTRADAIRFAKDECSKIRGAIMLVAPPLVELQCRAA